jgi:hypothetical protein
MKRFYFTRVLFVCCIVFTTSCTPAISNKVSPEEYELYSAWTAQHFAAKTPDQLFFFSRTFVFDPLEQYGCGDTLHGDNGVPWSQIKRLHALGEAEYPLDFYSKGRLDIPWPYKEVDSLPLDGRGTYRIVGFSRVAFNRDHTEGLFAISDSCGGLCGGGGARLARRENGKWTFRTTVCNWIY